MTRLNEGLPREGQRPSGQRSGGTQGKGLNEGLPREGQRRDGRIDSGGSERASTKGCPVKGSDLPSMRNGGAQSMPQRRAAP